MKRLCVLGSIAANAMLVRADATIPPANTVTPPTSASRRDIVSIWRGSSNCPIIVVLIMQVEVLIGYSTTA
jgi:hypothetical protein